jgi:GNAT superfamily N-acetyltransferase
MELIKPSTLTEFRRLIEPFVIAHEAEHGLIYGIAGTTAPPADAYCAVVVDHGVVVAAAVRTIVKLALSREHSPGAMAMIARDAIHDPGLRALLGPAASLRAFADASERRWRSVHGSTIYDCRSVAISQLASGDRRVAAKPDRALLARWVEEFVAEALPNAGAPANGEVAADRYIANGTMHLWIVDGAPVACAAALGPTPNAIRIGGVYTPPENRRHGYATALVADLTRDQLDRGRAFVYLYADRTNETSNSIYQKIGYNRVAESDELWLE